MADKGLSFEETACLIAALEENGTKLGKKIFDRMAKLGDRTSSGFEHHFRPIKARATALSAENGEPTTPVKATPAKGRKKSDTLKSASTKKNKQETTNTTKKRGRKQKDEDDSEDMDNKKIKTEVDAELSEDELGLDVKAEHEI